MKLNDANPTDTKLEKQLNNKKYNDKKRALNTEPKERKCRKDSLSGIRNISTLLIDARNVNYPTAKQCNADIGDTLYLVDAKGCYTPFKTLDSAIAYRTLTEKTK